MDEVFALTDFVPIVYALVVLIVGPIVALLFSGIDRKLVARLQARYGPPIMQPFYDVRKLMLKQTIVPKHAVGWIFSWAPVIALTAALALLLFVPIASYTAINGDLILIWYLLLFPSLALVVGGFAAGSPYAAIGAQREMVMMSSYEMPLSVVALAIAYTLNTFSMNAIQMSPIWGNVGILGILGFLVLFVVMLIGIAPELAKVPFDIPEAETEIAGGLLTEYSGRDFGFFYLSGIIKSFALSALVIALFFPYTFSWLLPTQDALVVVVWDVLVFLFKVFVLMFFSITLVRSTFARFRIEQASRFLLGWLLLISLIGLLLVVLDKVYPIALGVSL